MSKKRESEDDLCGPGFLTTGPHDPLARACQVHDWRYEDHHEKDPYAYKSREEADKEFSRNVDRLIEGQEFVHNRILPLRRVVAILYKRIVNTLGGFWWK